MAEISGDCVEDRVEGGGEAERRACCHTQGHGSPSADKEMWDKPEDSKFLRGRDET